MKVMLSRDTVVKLYDFSKMLLNRTSKTLGGRFAYKVSMNMYSLERESKSSLEKQKNDKEYQEWFKGRRELEANLAVKNDKDKPLMNASRSNFLYDDIDAANQVFKKFDNGYKNALKKNKEFFEEEIECDVKAVKLTEIPDSVTVNMEGVMTPIEVIGQVMLLMGKFIYDDEDSEDEYKEKKKNKNKKKK